MSAQLESARLDAQAGILARFGKAFDQAQVALEKRVADPMMRKMAAARIALEQAVLRTALEKGVKPELVAGALTAAKPEQQADLVRHGQAALARAYGVEPEMLVNVLAAKVVPVEVPKGFASNPEFDKLIDGARAQVTTLMQASYMERGKFVDLGDRANVTELAKSSGVQKERSELAARVAFIDSAIDAAVTKGAVGAEAAKMLKERVEAFIFEPRPPQSLQYSEKFKTFYASEGKVLRAEVMKEVRQVTQSKTIQEIGAKVDAALKQEPVRRGPELER